VILAIGTVTVRSALALPVSGDGGVVVIGEAEHALAGGRLTPQALCVRRRDRGLRDVVSGRSPLIVTLAPAENVVGRLAVAVTTTRAVLFASVASRTMPLVSIVAVLVPTLAVPPPPGEVGLSTMV
jgi:hypothetical protein